MPWAEMTRNGTDLAHEFQWQLAMVDSDRQQYS